MLDDGINYKSLQLSMNEELFCVPAFAESFGEARAQNSSLS